MLWSAFKLEVRKLMPQHNRRQGIQTLIDESIRNACVDLQDAVVCFQEGHVEEFVAADLTEDGYVSVGDLPDGRIVKASVVLFDDPDTDYCTDLELVWKPLSDDMRCGRYPARSGFIALDPIAGSFYVGPALDAETKLVLTWNGIKRSYSNGDEVPYNLTAAEAVAEYVLARLARQVDNNLSLAQSHGGSYSTLKRRLRRDCRAKMSLTPTDAYSL